MHPLLIAIGAGIAALGVILPTKKATPAAINPPAPPASNPPASEATSDGGGSQ